VRDDRCDLLCLDLPKAEAIRAARPSDRQARALAEGFRALGDPTRLTIALALREGGELCVCDLAWITERAEVIAVEATRDLIGSNHPEASWIGVGLAAFTAPTMPLLARAKRNVGRKLNSSATVSEANQNMICAYLSIALLAGLLANALLGWWWADPSAALVIAAVAAKEGVDSWRGESCNCC
jgi:DNA-binding transcriptional ArsR family regulator